MISQCYALFSALLRRRAEARSLKSKKNKFFAQSAFSYPSDPDWGRPVIVASPKALGKAAKGEACNYIVCAYKSSSSYAIIANLMYRSAGGYDDIPIGPLWLKSREEMWTRGLRRELRPRDLLEKK